MSSTNFSTVIGTLKSLFEALGFRFLGLGETGSASSPGSATQSVSLPADWRSESVNSGLFAFRYAHVQSSFTFLIKLLKMSDQIMITGLAVEDGRIYNMSRKVADIVLDNETLRRNLVQSGSGDSMTFANQLFLSDARANEFMKLYRSEVVDKMLPGLFDKGESTTSTTSSLRMEQRQENYPPDYYRRPPLQPPFGGIEDLIGPGGSGSGMRNPFRIGDQDLDPLGAMRPLQPGGGMFVGPDHPMIGGGSGIRPPFGGGGGPFQPGGAFPPGSVPPGARYDPIFPFNPDPMARPPMPGPGRGRPNNSAPPFPGEPDNDDFRPPYL